MVGVNCATVLKDIALLGGTLSKMHQLYLRRDARKRLKDNGTKSRVLAAVFLA